ncbi:helix-turn-helix domain-containing protein [Alicyclobacillus ferrooxydans]|uniref:HTH cro/C1-type domain-containing protein n=1 Tax=Alicyclobacillus ferrooxydans TaxID=471514 RepID=A0A0P9EJJ6_9BACL|nr:helix-turn-helix transcriptional regulator [Alicyclobacillus ferrooxydans]KPV43150.1 hypothetical protein AN477_13740 [Alicyclobacillus ferrooxydans]
MIKIHLTRVLAERNLTQRQFAAIAGVRPNAVNALCNANNPTVKSGSRRIDLDILDRVCRALDIQPADLLEYVPDKGLGVIDRQQTDYGLYIKKD